MRSECVLHTAVLLSHLLYEVSSSSPQQFIFNMRPDCADSQCGSLTNMTVRSRTECAATCGYNSDCAGFFYTLAGECVLAGDWCLPTSPCHSHVYQKHIYTPLCFNQGTWDAARLACICTNGWVGSRCQRMAYRCEELYRYGYPPGVYHVDIDVFRNQTRLIHTKCDIGSNWWRTFIFTSDARTDYNRSWLQYQSGFQQDSWNQWLGLDNMLALNQMGHVTVTFSVVVQSSSLVSEFVYENFRMSDVSSGYAYTYSHSHNRTFGDYLLPGDSYLDDVLSYTRGMSFSTFDHDRDNDSKNCAALYGAGWWIGTCAAGLAINPLGLNPKSSPSVSELSQLQIPAINFSEPAIMKSFQSVFMTFTD